MNYLAHLYLAAPNPHLMVGNFIADAVKGNPTGLFSPPIVEGIKMHRAIDSFTDQHPATKEFVALLRPDYGRYAPVLSDVLYDYLLATQWANHSNEELPLFAKGVYDVLLPFKPDFPQRMQLFYDRMVEYDFLTNYGTEYGITQTLKALGNRVSLDVDITSSIGLVRSNQTIVNQLFELFISDLKKEFKS